MKIKKSRKKKEIPEAIETEENEGYTNKEKMKKIVLAECMVVVVLVIALIVGAVYLLQALTRKKSAEKALFSEERCDPG